MRDIYWGMCLVGHLGRQTLEHTSFPSNPLRRPDSRVLPFKASLRPAVVFLACPVRASLDVLGRKRSLLILYSLGFMRVDRFNEMRAYMPEITGSVLAKRLSQLEKSGYVKRKNQRNESRYRCNLAAHREGKGYCSHHHESHRPFIKMECKRTLLGWDSEEPSSDLSTTNQRLKLASQAAMPDWLCNQEGFVDSQLACLEFGCQGKRVFSWESYNSVVRSQLLA